MLSPTRIKGEAMKKFILGLLLMVACSSASFSQERQITIKAGTIVPLEAVSALRASKADEGQKVDFKVSRDVVIDGIVAIPQGTIAKGTVYEAKRSSWWGTKGRLGIKLNYLTLPSGDNVNFTSSNVYITGKNRTAISVVSFLFIWPCCFICGSKAEMPIGYECDATVASNTLVTIE